MAAKKKEQEVNESIEFGSKEFFNELIKGTDFVKCDEGSLMNNRPKVLTPLHVLNCITGGGLPLAIQEEVSGVPASGKSTFCYSMLGTFQKQYGDNGVGVILDLEGSTDDTRLKQLGIDSSKVLRLPAVSIESAFENMFKMFKKLIDMKEKTGKDIKLFIIFDSLSAGGIQAQHDSIEQGGTAMTFGSGMMALPRILKQNMANVTPFLEKIDASVHYINQVFMQGIGTYAPKTGSGGGYGKDHMMDLKLEFGTAKNDIIKEGSTDYMVGSYSNLKITKSKLGPKFTNIPCYVDVRNGGTIDEVKSLFMYLQNSDYIKTGAWQKFDDIFDYMEEKFGDKLNIEQLNQLRGNKRGNDLLLAMREDVDLVDFMQIFLIEKICDVYPAHSLVTNEFRQTLVNKCNYFIDKNLPVRNVNEVEELDKEVITEDNESK